MSVPAESAISNSAAHLDQRVTLHGVSWDDYEALLSMRGDSAGVRVTYLEGELELMTASVDHEDLKTRIGRLLETYAMERGIALEGYGSWTVRSKPRERGAEAGECYMVGIPESKPERPDIAIEVVWTSGGLDKLEVYRGLALPEVWIWREGGLHFYLLRGDDYVASPRSTLLPDLDPTLIDRCMAAPSQTDAVRALREALAQSQG